MVKKSLNLLYRTTFWLISVIVIILLIAALTIQFLVFPNINQYKEKIAAYASEAAKQKIVIGNIKAGWLGVHPYLSLANIDIYDAENRPALQLKNTDVSLSWLSIPLLEPHLANLTVRTPELTIRRDIEGQVFVAGIKMQGPSKPDLPNWLLRQNKFEVIDAKVIWLDELRKAPTLSLNKLNLQVISPPWKSFLKNHRVTFNAQPSVGSNQPVSINADVYGNDISKIAEWRGNIDLQLKNTDIAAFKPWVDYSPLTQPIVLQSGTGSSDTKLQFAKNQLESVDSTVALDNVQLQLKANAVPVILNKLAGELHWKNTKTSQAFSVNKLSLNTNNGLNIEDASASYSKNNQADEKLDLNFTEIDLALVQPYLVQLPLPDTTMQRVTSLSPVGKLHHLKLFWSGKNSITKAYQLDTKFSGLSIQANEKIPGFENLTGSIEANQKAGKVTLNTQNAKLDFKDILRWPIPVDQLNGGISWNINPQDTFITVKKLNISNPHLAGSLDATYLLDGNKGGLLDLKGKFGNGNAKFAPFYYPIMLGTTTLHWLDTSILSGRADDINLTVKGRLADFPFVDSKNNLDSKLGLFRVTAKISGSELEYGTGWPNIQGLGLDLLFEGKRMELNANAGHLFGNEIIKSKTTIAQLDADSPMLNIVSELKGPVPDGVTFVNKSPVREVTQGLTEDLKTSGQGKLALTLNIPMQNLEAAKYKGVYQITNGTMASSSVPTLTRINGLLEFTESSLTAKNIIASAYGSPVTFSINTNKDKSINVAASGKINDAGIKQLLLEQVPSNPSLAKGAHYLAGSTNWSGNIHIVKPIVNIDIHSDLVGLSSTFPAPFNKTAQEPLALALRLSSKEEASGSTLGLSLANKLAAKIANVTEGGKLKLDRGSIRFNTGESVSAKTVDGNNNIDLAATKGLQVYGSLDYLNIDAWRKVLQEISDAKSQDTGLPVQKIALKINTLDIFGRRVNQLKIANYAEKDGLRANVQSREITGDLQWSGLNNGKLIAHLSNLTVPDATPNSPKPMAEDSADKTFDKLDQDYPALDITADNFEFNHKKFGGLELIAYPQNDNWIIRKLKLNTPDSTINAEGVWNNWTKNPNTYLNIDWNIKNLGKVLKDLGYPETIKGGEGALSGQLHWPGSPHEFNAAGLNGEFQLELKKGQILKVQPGVGRLLGLLSLQSLPRRLTLDFRDLFSNGFAFDKISGTAKIDRGMMRSDNFEMAGPAADVTMKGETNLQKETQHLFVKVLPRVGDSLSLAALAGGPLAGAIAFLAQKILKDPLNKIASTEYEIVGTWDNPQEIKANKENAQ